MSNLIETKSSIKTKQTLQQHQICSSSSTPLGTPPNNTPFSSPPHNSPILGSRITRSNSACVNESSELLPFRFNTKISNQRRNTQLLQTSDPHDITSIYYHHRLQSLRTVAAGAQKSNSLIKKDSLINCRFNNDFKESLDEDEMEDLTKNFALNENDQTKNNLELSSNVTNDVSQDILKETSLLSDNLDQIKLVEQSNDHYQVNNQFTNRINSQETNTFDKLTSMKEDENHLVRRYFKSGQDLDELIKENKNDDLAQDNEERLKKIMATAEMRKNQLFLLLDEHQQIVTKIKLAEMK